MPSTIIRTNSKPKPSPNFIFKLNLFITSSSQLSQSLRTATLSTKGSAVGKRTLSPYCCGLGSLRHLAGFFDVEHVHEAVVQFVDSDDDCADRAAQSSRGRLERGFVDFDHIANLVHQ